MIRDLKAAGRPLPRTGAEELAGGSGRPAGVVDFMRGAEAEAFAGAVVELVGDGIAGFLGEVIEAGALGEVLYVSGGVPHSASLISTHCVTDSDAHGHRR